MATLPTKHGLPLNHRDAESSKVERTLCVCSEVVSREKLFQVALGSPLIPLLKRGLDAGEFLSLNSVADAGKPFLVALISQISNRPVLVVTDGLKSQEKFFNDLQTFLSDALLFPAWETLPHESVLPHADTIADRLRVLNVICGTALPAATSAGSEEHRPRNGAPKIVASVQALMQKTFSRSTLLSLRSSLSVGQHLDLQEFTAMLIERGYSPEVQVNERGDMAVRGGIVDFFPIERDLPVRVELAGDEIESIREFDPVSQQSKEKLDSLIVTPAGEVTLLKKTTDHVARLVDLLPRDTLLVLDEPDNLVLAADQYARQIPQNDRFFAPWKQTLDAGLSVVQLTETIALEPPDNYLNLRLSSLEAYRPLDTRAPDPQIAESTRRMFFDQMQRWLDEGYRLHIICSTEGERTRFEELWKEYAPRSPLYASIGFLSRGVLWPDAKLAVITDSEIFGRYKPARPRQRFHAASSPISDWTELEPGDFVVHVQHGIGNFLGLKTLEVGAASTPRPGIGMGTPPLSQKVRQEVLAIEYANEARLYVPVEQTHLISKYIGAGKRIPKLHELGGTLWQRQKFSAERAIMDIASELLEIQAARATLEGHAFSPDAPWQREFEAAFIYEETPDQLTAIEEVKTDMESRKPMDRLICGDVGYGKTEVAIRSGFKVVIDGFQVAVLCPTTVLAEQHWNTFRERMAGYPIAVEMLSRFRTPGEQKKIVKLVREGGVDIVIGTHRLLSADMQFKNLGLVIIDEEQRFGVLHKERFKQLRKLVDVLTLSATPIPRTLYLALSGARDMSTIETPPQDRLPVETIIAPYDERMIKQAIQREINRGGQVYFLHNRVQSIDAVADRLRNMFETDGRPSETLSQIALESGRATPRRDHVTIDVGHGQMSEHELESVMHRFVNGDIDVLVCTTIIESGLDIPNANTIIIDRADRFGLSDLYQLRGRVGRYKHQAYAYILLPRHLQLIQSARKRITAIKQYSSLGSGFKIAMRDLEIRGAGNILGAEQSGHISAIGFGLYCQLLKESIARLKGQKTKRLPQVTMKLDFLTGESGNSLTRLPADYIQETQLRIQAYRKIAGATELPELETIHAELRDRYGRLPREAKLLLIAAEIRILAGNAHVEIVETKEDKIMLTQRGQLFQIGGKFPRLMSTKPETRFAELKKLLASLETK
jgi:transcription-repair coupling factor (superfamily II helicase)